jgi:acylphosphatase
MTTPSGATELECWQARIMGRVQGVGYREGCMRRAAALGIRGWVRNRSDGSVEAMLQGPAESLAQMRAWLERGPPAAAVERVTLNRVDAPGPQLAGFERRPTL